MSETSERLERLGIKLPVRDRKGKGVVDAVIDGNMMYLSLALPVDADGIRHIPARSEQILRLRRLIRLQSFAV